MESGPRHDNLVRVETPESVWLTFRVAGPGVRLGAYLLDLFIRATLLFAVAFAASQIAFLEGDSGLLTGILLVSFFLLEWGYGTYFEAFRNGRTPGKRAFELRVVKVGGYAVGFFDAFLRNLLRVADGLPFLIAVHLFPTYGFGLLSMFLSPKMQRLGDLLAGTMVVHDPAHSRRRVLDLPEEIRPISRQELRSGYRPTERTLDLIASLRTRHRTIPRRRREEISKLLAGPLRERLGYEPAAAPDTEAPDPESAETFLLRVLKTFQEQPPVPEAES